MLFQRENISVGFFDEALPLFVDHHREVSFFRKDSTLSVDIEQYLLIDSLGKLRLYTARDKEGKLTGYCAFILGSHLHYKELMIASQTAIFIPEKSRGFGWKFIKWCNEKLINDGATHVIQRVTKDCNFSPILLREGFEFMEAAYVKTLSKEAA